MNRNHLGACFVILTVMLALAIVCLGEGQKNPTQVTLIILIWQLVFGLLVIHVHCLLQTRIWQRDQKLSLVLAWSTWSAAYRRFVYRYGSGTFWSQVLLHFGIMIFLLETGIVVIAISCGALVIVLSRPAGERIRGLVTLRHWRKICLNVLSQPVFILFMTYEYGEFLPGLCRATLGLFR
jgi:hypothetical protein